jgi:hypothetical protein
VDGPSWTDVVSLEAANDVTGAVLLDFNLKHSIIIFRLYNFTPQR